MNMFISNAKGTFSLQRLDAADSPTFPQGNIIIQV